MIVDDRVEHDIYIAAPPEVVFAYLIDPAKHERWMGREVQADPRPGGAYRCVVNDEATVIGEYLVVDPPKQLSYTFGWEANYGVPPGSSVVTITLTPENGGTRLRLVHTGLPADALEQHDLGWTRYVPRLATLAGGGDPGPDSWHEEMTA